MNASPVNYFEIRIFFTSISGLSLWSSTLTVVDMADDHHESSGGSLNTNSMPEAVQMLIDAMIGINPEFSFADWLEQKANEDLSLLSSDLERERIQIEQRLHRLNNITYRLSDGESALPKGQTNLFDCFDLPEPMKHLAKRVDVMEITEIPHPAGSFLDLMPTDCSDDPLLAISAQLMMMIAQEKVGKGSPWATVDDLFDGLEARGISSAECEEALDHLIMTGQLHEVDDDCFVPED